MEPSRPKRSTYFDAGVYLASTEIPCDGFSAGCARPSRLLFAATGYWRGEATGFERLAPQCRPVMRAAFERREPRYSPRQEASRAAGTSAKLFEQILCAGRRATRCRRGRCLGRCRRRRRGKPLQNVRWPRLVFCDERQADRGGEEHNRQHAVVRVRTLPAPRPVRKAPCPPPMPSAPPSERCSSTRPIMASTTIRWITMRTVVMHSSFLGARLLHEAAGALKRQAAGCARARWRGSPPPSGSRRRPARHSRPARQGSPRHWPASSSPRKGCARRRPAAPKRAIEPGADMGMHGARCHPRSACGPCRSPRPARRRRRCRRARRPAPSRASCRVTTASVSPASRSLLRLADADDRREAGAPRRLRLGAHDRVASRHDRCAAPNGRR